MKYETLLDLENRLDKSYAEKRKKNMENKSKLDVYFIELYIKKMYGEDLSQYYLVTPGVTSRWKHDFPSSRMHEFTFREGSRDIEELIKRIYE